eukprot:3807152-Ditylum_brightwellii.AAC.1
MMKPSTSALEIISEDVDTFTTEDNSNTTHLEFLPERDVVTNSRRELAYRKSSIKLSSDELSKLADIQHHIGSEDDAFASTKIKNHAKESEKARDGVKLMRKQMLFAMLKARTTGNDGAEGVLVDDAEVTNSG